MGSKLDGPSGPRSRFFIVGLSHFQRGIGPYTWLACKTDISEEVRNHRSDVISWLFVVPRLHTHSFSTTHFIVLMLRAIITTVTNRAALNWFRAPKHFWRSEEKSIWCHFLTICGPLTTYTQIFDHSFHCINATGINQNSHKSRCSQLISGTKALQFVTFWKFLSLTENTGEHRSKDIDHIYGVQIWWSEGSQVTIFHSWT